MKDTEVKAAIELLRAMTKWAYETGFHETGYDPVDTVSTALSGLRSERDTAREIAESLRLVLLEESNGLVLANLRAGLIEDELNTTRKEVATYRKTLDEVAELGIAAVDRAEVAKAEADTLRKEIERLQALLLERDD